jgi:hypothetical protein
MAGSMPSAFADPVQSLQLAQALEHIEPSPLHPPVHPLQAVHWHPQ